MLVGSGNLTFNGWGGNVELLEHLHPSFAVDAIADTAEYSELLPVTERVRFGAKDECASIAADLCRASLSTATSAPFTISTSRFRPRSCRSLTTSAARRGSLPPLPSGMWPPLSTVFEVHEVGPSQPE